MSDEITIASTSDTPEQIEQAMALGVTPPNPDQVLSVEGEEPKVEEVPAEEPPTEEKPAEKVEAKAEGKEDEKPAEKPVEAAKLEEDDEVGARTKKRIDRLTWEREEARRREDVALARVAELEAAAKPPAKPEPVVAVVPKVDEKTLDTTFRTANPEPQQEDQPDYDTFVKVWTKWEMDRRESISVAKAEAAGRAAAQQVIDEKTKKDADAAEATARKNAMDLFEERRVEARGRYEDFDTVIADAKDMNLSGIMHYFVVDSPVGNDIAYWLANHPEEAKELASLEGPAAIREMGRLERDIEIAVAATTEETPAPKKVAAPAGAVPVVKKATAAPAPITPVGGTRGVTSVDLNDPNLSYQDYKKRMNEKEAARRRR